ncbi:MAG: phenylalanine--tRNA ligase subunit beta [Oligoflexia bacterium]|nr:phenylalanine--tRNA ligase subunit beta [Oligoflexia bacterium]
MRISWKWLSEMVDLSGVGGPQGLAELLTRRGLEVEAIERQDAGFDRVVTAQILERNRHPQADRLSLCLVTTGQGDPQEIVCGAQNMKAGDKVALAQIGAHLPNDVKIERSKIRGVTSNGMLCSEEELKLKEKAEGIMILPPETPLGRPLAELLGRDDTILTLKLTANRGDCLSHYGIAREVAAALGQSAKRPEAPLLQEGGCPITIELQAGQAAPQFFGAYLDGVKVGPSPAWLVRRLEASGSRSINNVVDASNLVMLELGHPVHIYDADRIEGARIGVRVGREGEELPLLDGTQVRLAGTELVIFDGKRSVGLAGVMGGGNSEVQEGTTRVFLECAEFDPKLVRRASSRHQKKTDAAHRFERGIDPQALPQVLARLAQLVQKLAGGRVVGSVSARLDLPRSRAITVAPGWFGDFLGMEVTEARAAAILEGLGCRIEKGGAQWKVTAPSYRRDLSIPEDLAEEVARTIGYDAIHETVPVLTSAPRALSAPESATAASFRLLLRAKELLAGLGLCEALNYSFTSRAWLSKFGMSSSALVVNPLSEEHEAMIPSLLPGLVRNALDNWNRHFGSEALPIRLFEIRPTFRAAEGGLKAQGEMETGAKELWRLAAVLSGPRFAGGLRNELGEVDFYDLKSVVERLFEGLGTRGMRFQPLTASRSGGNPLFHPGQSVEILAGKGDVVGHFGLLHPGKARDLKARAPLWMIEVDWEVLQKLSRTAWEVPAFRAWSEFPPIERDFALIVKGEVSADRISQVALKAGKPLAKVAKIFDVYRSSQLGEGVTSVAVRVIFYEENRSLQESEAETVSAQILNAWKKELGIELRS